MARSTLVILVLALVLILPSAGWGCGIEAWNFANGNFFNFTDGNWTFGEVFIPSQDLSVIFLGYYNPSFPVPGWSFTSPHPVGLFDAAGDLMASTVIDNTSMYGVHQSLISGEQSGNFAFNWISPVTLHAGQTYVIEGVSNVDPYTWDDPAFTVYLPVTILGNNEVAGNGLNFNGTFLMNGVSNGYWGANFGVGPEPGSLIMFGSGVLGLAGLLRRKLNL